MHQQIRTSPGQVGENIRRVADALGDAGISVEGIGPDFEAPHVRTVVTHERFEATMEALENAHLEPEARPAITFALANQAGALQGVLRRLAHEGYTVESVLVLASRSDDGRVLVSIGVRQTIPDGWDAKIDELGGWEEPEGWSASEAG
jgi:hypothetical protein